MTSLTRLEEVEQAIYDRHIIVKYVKPDSPLLGGKNACPRYNKQTKQFYIILNCRLTYHERLEVLLHEWGHLETHNGGRGASRERSEMCAWRWAYEYFFDYDELLSLFEGRFSDCDNVVELLADYYDVTPRFIIGACRYYQIDIGRR